MVSAMEQRKRRHAVRHRLWGLGALHQAEIDIAMANRQLVRPASGVGFRAGVAPPPLTDAEDIQPTFEGPIRRGTNPTGNYCSAVAGNYNLADRVETHLPGSRRWLLEDIAFFFNDGAPDINETADSMDRILARIGLRRLSWSAAIFGEKRLRETYWLLAQRQLEYFATLPSPDHLQLLTCFYHERTWLAPFSAERQNRYIWLVQHACASAIDVLCTHPVLDAAHTGVDMPQEIRTAFDHVRRGIQYFGVRSHARPSRHAEPLFSPTLFIKDFDGIDDADLCAGLGFATTEEHQKNPKHGRYSLDIEPTRQESDRALLALLDHLDVPPDLHVRGYDAPRPHEEFFWKRFSTCS